MTKEKWRQMIELILNKYMSNEYWPFHGPFGDDEALDECVEITLKFFNENYGKE